MRRITGALYEAQYTFLIIARQSLLRMRIVSNKSLREIQNTNFVFNKLFFEYHVINEII